ncbi:MAG: hypothetical protein ABFS46_18825 [Myxococcota bacterium]
MRVVGLKVGWLVAALLAAPGPVPADPAEAAAPTPEIAFPALEHLEDERLLGIWREGVELEVREELLAATACYEDIARELPRSPFIHWRIARNYWRVGERLPWEDKAGRMYYFELAEGWADGGLALDERCGECVLWKLAARGRQASTGGRARAARLASEIAELIDRGIALQPSHRDHAANATLGNLYYAGSAFYRILPDWWWLKLVIGVRGDKRRALDYIHRALEISDSRIDYWVELGAVQLCIGHSRGKPKRIEEGRVALRRALELEHFQSTDRYDVEHARILLRTPERACGYARDGWIELDDPRERVAEPAAPEVG